MGEGDTSIFCSPFSSYLAAGLLRRVQSRLNLAGFVLMPSFFGREGSRKCARGFIYLSIIESATSAGVP